ncbi:hypothetical protein SPONN_577 [uncultured Candidatus Thioglobus sp.]|nr:hypothetical protein SPONN_577 [uncultured Candidatus Thioglobus sp.]
MEIKTLKQQLDIKKTPEYLSSASSIDPTTALQIRTLCVLLALQAVVS